MGIEQEKSPTKDDYECFLALMAGPSDPSTVTKEVEAINYS